MPKQKTDKEKYEDMIFIQTVMKDTKEMVSTLQKPNIYPDSHYKIKAGLWEIIKDYEEVKHAVKNHNV